MIDPRAAVDPDARIGRDVSIGPFAVIGPDVELGDGCQVGPHAVISGWTRIGRNNRIYQFCSIGEAPQHLGYKGERTEVVIGDNNVLREYCTVNRGTVDGGAVTRIGNDNFIMAYCHVAHDCVVGDHTVFANCSSLAGHVEIGDYCILGGFTLVHQFCRVGAHCITGIGSVTFKDIPPYLMVAGNTAEPHGLNIKGLSRRGFTPDTIAGLRRAYKLLYRSQLRLSEALDQLAPLAAESPEVAHLVEFIRQSERGIVR
jgi:UDP-N-acetylglucosamine acyltransferase